MACCAPRPACCPGNGASIPVNITDERIELVVDPPVPLTSPPHSFYVACDSIVQVTWSGTISEPTFPTGVATDVITVQLALGNAALTPSSVTVYAPNPPRVRVRAADDVLPISATFTTMLPRGTYYAYVLLTSGTDGTAIYIDGSLSVVSYKFT
jgi:hypothetical protein